MYMYVYNSANCINNNFFSQDMKIAKVLWVLYTVADKKSGTHFHSQNGNHEH